MLNAVLGRWKKLLLLGGEGKEPPNFLGWGGRKELLQQGLCKSPLFACSVLAACHTRA